jgi:hypothetical protein
MLEHSLSSIISADTLLHVLQLQIKNTEIPDDNYNREYFHHINVVIKSLQSFIDIKNNLKNVTDCNNYNILLTKLKGIKDKIGKLPVSYIIENNIRELSEKFPDFINKVDFKKQLDLDTIDSKEVNTTPYKMISTTMIAYDYKVSTASLNSFLRKIGWINKINGRFRLTAIGKQNGGRYSDSDHINWPYNLLDKEIFQALIYGERSKIVRSVAKESPDDFDENRNLEYPNEEKQTTDNVKCKSFKIEFPNCSDPVGLNDFNSFLQKIELISTHASLMNMDPESWSVLIFYKDRISNDLSKETKLQDAIEEQEVNDKDFDEIQKAVLSELKKMEA